MLPIFGGPYGPWWPPPRAAGKGLLEGIVPVSRSFMLWVSAVSMQRYVYGLLQTLWASDGDGRCDPGSAYLLMVLRQRQLEDLCL